MTFRSYLWGMRVSTLFALAGWILVLFNIDPEKSGAVGQFLFYGSTFLLFSGIFILFFTWLGKKSDGETAEVVHISVSFRQGVLLSLLTLILLFFQQNRILTWWDGLLAVAGIFLIELYFLSHKK